MHLIPQVLFILIFGITVYVASKKYMSIRRNILLGRDEDLSDNPALRWKNMVLFALGQKKMFRNFIPAFFHLFIYVSFVIVNIEVLEIAIDGIFGTHRFFAPYLGGFYTFLISFIEMLSALALIATFIFIIRRNIIKVKRFTQPELKGWPFKDANFILLMELILVTAILMMNATDYQLQLRDAEHYANTGKLCVAQYTSNLFSSVGTENLILLERFFWWTHIIGILFFLNYIPYSKHLHIFLAFPNTYYSRNEKKGIMQNMPVVMNEVKTILDPSAQVNAIIDPPKSFGAKDVTDLTWKHLLDAYSCTECGRCTDACPANITGKKLSPRKIMMDTRDRLEEVGNNITKHGKDFSDNKSLLGDYITHEEIRACTSCNACVEECPVNINPLSIILELRRYAIMEQSDAPAAWNTMFNNMENNQSPWQFNPMDRANWIEEIK
ncbi:MAG: 4Fe-4S dicluster domain-containing protein [Fimbriimonadaceae bacterium]|nr:4Fe-4S dicluster domain-containing protein [Chitinophagales bacterium]